MDSRRPVYGNSEVHGSYFAEAFRIFFQLRAISIDGHENVLAPYIFQQFNNKGSKKDFAAPDNQGFNMVGSQFVNNSFPVIEQQFRTAIAFFMHIALPAPLSAH